MSLQVPLASVTVTPLESAGRVLPSWETAAEEVLEAPAGVIYYTARWSDGEELEGRIDTEWGQQDPLARDVWRSLMLASGWWRPADVAPGQLERARAGKVTPANERALRLLGSYELPRLAGNRLQRLGVRPCQPALAGVDIDGEGLITTPGPFAGAPRWVPVLWDLAGKGFARKRAGGYVFRFVEAEPLTIDFPELAGVVVARVWQRPDGTVAFGVE